MTARPRTGDVSKATFGTESVLNVAVPTRRVGP
jgi:hypothetical protein